VCAFDAKERGPHYPAGSSGYIVAKPMKTQKNSLNDAPFAFPVSPDRDFPKIF